MNDRTYVKLYRGLLDNPVFARDIKASHVFVALLLLVDRKTGIYRGGRHKLAAITGVKDRTLYDICKRLEKHTMITCSPHANYTEISVVNWAKYQTAHMEDVNDTNDARVEYNTITRTKNLELRNSNYVEQPAAVRPVYDHFIEKFDKNPNRYQLSVARKKKIKTRLHDAGQEMVCKAITNLSASSFHRGDNERGWEADLDWLLSSYERVEKWASQNASSDVGMTVEEAMKNA